MQWTVVAAAGARLTTTALSTPAAATVPALLAVALEMTNVFRAQLQTTMSTQAEGALRAAQMRVGLLGPQFALATQTMQWTVVAADGARLATTAFSVPQALTLTEA